MSTKTASTVSRLLANAVVIDLDFSVWDELVRVVIAADEETLSADSDLYNVDFVGCQSVSYDAGRPLAFSRKDDRHTRWIVSEAKLSELGAGFRVEMRGHGPDLNLECRELRVERLGKEAALLLNKRWYEPGQALVRPSAEALHRQFTAASSRRS